MMKNVYKFEKGIKIKFKNRSLITAALTHKSANEKFNNEKKGSFFKFWKWNQAVRIDRFFKEIK